ncbi:DUF1289 domain-containing protein [Haliea sp. AH-315-K21]|uniref:DUF1289 domain-containing protein n=1 Tax=SAR86 cluster bacterium TaxID=2030880 RepID=A0A2A5C861_9GAMM|nr:DUF1289 domain-containing protein [Haliea sp. AH-315-K21]PCJ39997.1 MAG: DUF1289 domain-containing protein [SAR86 cluster bacterium]
MFNILPSLLQFICHKALQFVYMNQIKTPCIGICSTTSFGDKICRGCKRFNFEVINWNSYSEQEKLAVFSRIDLLTEQILRNKFRIVSVSKLQEVMHDFRFFYHPDLSSYCWLHGFLQKKAYKIKTLNEIGVELMPEFSNSSVDEVMQRINDELQLLSEAHFQRYFQR